MTRFLVIIAVLVAAPALADSVIATRLIQAQAQVSADDITLVAAEIPGAVKNPLLAIGREARVTLYPGRAILVSDLTTPFIIDRNQIVNLVFRVGSLGIVTQGRALAKGGIGDVIRVMNTASRSTVTGRIVEDGTVQVGP